MRATEPESKTFGANEVFFLAPDVISCSLRGIMTETDATELTKFVTASVEYVGGPVFAIYDLSEFERLSVGVRNATLHGDWGSAYRAMALLNASFATRTFIDMVARAGKIISKQPLGFQHRFAKTPNEALAWFDELRQSRGT